ncbi:MAG: caspase family protein, partial [Promethearchaeota archaeon]
MKKRSITLIALLFLGSFTFSTISRFFHTSYLNLMGKKPSLSATILPELFWNKTWGGSGGEGCLDIAIDSQNNIYLVGYTRSYGAGDRDIALVKFDPSGVDLWYRTWGTTGFEVGYSIQIDSFDNIYIAGTSDGRHALIKYSNDGEELWNKTWRAYAYEFFPSDIVLDSSDNVYFCGKGKEWNEYFLGKFDSLGNLLWNQTWKEDYGRGELGGIDLDSNGNIYTLGKYYGRFKAYRLFKFNTSGDLTWDILWGEGEDLVEYGWANLYDIKCDSVGNIFLGGYRGFEYNGDLQYEFLLLKYNGSGTQVWNKTYGDLYHQFCLAITVDKYDNIYMLGDTDVNDNEDLLLIKVDNSGTFLWDYIWETPSGEPWNSGLALDDLNNIYLGGVCSPGDMFLLKLHVFYLKINKPLSNTTYGLESPSFELELDTEYVHSTWYTLNDGSKYFFLGESGKINQTEWDLFEDGTINIKFYANDTLGYVDCIQVIVGKDTIKPSLDVLAPSAYQLYGNHSPNFIVSVDDPNLDSSWYTLDGGLSNHTFTGFWNTINQVAWDACGNGTVTIEFYANDTAGNIAFQELIVRKDINAPYIRILSPQSLKIYPNKSLNFEIEIYGSDIDATWYNLNDGSNYLFSGTYGTINNTAWGPCLDGINFLKFFVNDSSSRTVFQDILIYKDSILPIIDIISPIQDQYFLDSIPTYEVDIFDTNLNATWYSLDNGQTNYTFSESLGTINQTAWESLLNGYVNLTFYAIDHAGNIGYNVVTIFKNQTLLPKNAYAIIIGISNYPGSDYDLNYCDDDAIAVYNMIVNDYNFKSEHVIYLEDTNATKSSINNAFDSISSVIKPNDVFFFYYSGHGGRGTYSTQGTWNVESLHPYWNDYDQIWSVSHPEAIYMRAHFERFQTEPDYDFLLCGGWGVTQGYYYELLTGDLGYNFWSNYIPVSNYFIRFISDSSNPYPYYGFKIDKYEAILEDGTHYLCSYDSIPSNPSAYYMDSLIDSKLDSLNCADKYVVVDACNSGGLIPEVQDIGRYIMTACENDEESLETPSLEHGIFTYYLLESQENADDQNEDGVISMEECYDYVYSNTVSHSGSYGSEYRYHPQEYDGISGESVLYPSIGSVNIST